MKNQVQLITYIDRLSAGRIRDLHILLTSELRNVFGGVHLLPFFHPIDGADAGFDPIDHTTIDPRLGTWSDIEALARDIEVTADVIVNHISSSSPQFIDYIRNVGSSKYDGLFLTLESVFPSGATERDLLAIFRQQANLPFTVARLADGSTRALWTTFTSQQIDINVEHAQGRSYLTAVIQMLARHGVKMIRLDAVGYAVKRAGTTCFMIPETFEFIDSLTQLAHSAGMEVLVEVHGHYRHQIQVARHVDRVYDFALAPLVLQTLANKNAKHLKQWIAIRPANAINVLDTHDGVGVIDAGSDTTDPTRWPGLVPDDELSTLVDLIHARTLGTSKLASGTAASNVDENQINTTFYDAVGGSDEEYLAARAIQFFLPGIPQVYYVGLLAGSNNMELLNRTRVGRDINRHYYSRADLVQQLAKPVVEAQLALIKLRNSHAAFTGTFELLPGGDDTLHLRWSNALDFAEMRLQLQPFSYRVRYSDAGAIKTLRAPAEEAA